MQKSIVILALLCAAGAQARVLTATNSTAAPVRAAVSAPVVVAPAPVAAPTVVPVAGITLLTPSPALPAATAASTNTTSNKTGPVRPASGTNLMVVMTVAGQETSDVLKHQGALRQSLADSAKVPVTSVYFYNQTARTDPRTGQETVSLVMNIACQDKGQCASAGNMLFNGTTQDKFTTELSRSNVALLPNTFQVYGTSLPKGENGKTSLTAAALAPPPASALPLGLALPLGGLGMNATTGANASFLPFGSYNGAGNMTMGGMMGGNGSSMGILGAPGTLVTAANASSMLPAANGSAAAAAMASPSPSPVPAKSGASAATGSAVATILAVVAAAALL